MGVSCNIVVTNPPDGPHKAGDTVKGQIIYYIDEPTEYRNVTIKLIGRGNFSYERGSGDDKKYYTGKEEIINRTINVIDKKEDENVTLPFGSYTYPFEFHLPFDIPPSYENKTRNSINYSGTWNIKYLIIATFEKPSLFSFNRTFERDLIIYGTVKPIAPDGPLTLAIEKPIEPIIPLMCFNQRSGDMMFLKSTINKAFLAPGETIMLNYEVDNRTNVRISKINTELLQKTTLTTNEGLFQSKITNTLEKTFGWSETGSISEYTKTFFRVTMPIKPELYSIQNSGIISVEYFVRIKLVPPMPYTNLVLEIPIAIGERRGENTSNVCDIREFDSDEDLDPPTYDEAVGDKNACPIKK